MAKFTTEQAELAATTHMVATDLARDQNSSVSAAQIIEGVHAWKERRAKPFSADRIETCLRWLIDEQWVCLDVTDIAR